MYKKKHICFESGIYVAFFTNKIVNFTANSFTQLKYSKKALAINFIGFFLLVHILYYTGRAWLDLPGAVVTSQDARDGTENLRLQSTD